MASELEKLAELQRKLNERNRKARTKEYQKLGCANAAINYHCGFHALERKLLAD